MGTKILALESAGAACSATISINGVLQAEYTIFEANKHDKFLAEFAKRLLNDFSIKPTDLDAIAVSAGPGSFTGLRISGSIAKAMCFDGEPKLIAVPNLEAFAFACIEKNTQQNNFNKVSATIKAQKDLLYYQDFSRDFSSLSEPVLLSEEEYLQLDFSDAIVCGTAAHLFPDLPRDLSVSSFSARLIAALASKMYAKGIFCDPADYTPMYVQDFKPRNQQ